MSDRRQNDLVKPALALLALMMAVGPFADTEYTPAMPAIAQGLHVSYSLVQLSMASYLFGSSASELFYGPLSDRYGRRLIMNIGGGILSLGALICLVSFWAWPLIAGRLVQGIGACAGGVISKAAVRDAYPQEQRERVFAEIQATFALAPALGPIVGSLVTHHMNWRVNFVIMLALSLLMWGLVWRYLPETNPHPNRHALEPVRIWRNYKRPLANRDFVSYAVINGCCIGVVYTALLGAPGIAIKVMHRGSDTIVIIAFAILLGFITGAGVCGLISNRVRDLWIIAAGLTVLALASLAQLAVGLIVGEHGNVPEYLIPVSICFTGIGLVAPVCMAKAMEPFQHIVGSASSMLGFLQMMVAALGTAVMSLLPGSSVYTMPYVFLGLTAVAVLVFVSNFALPAVVAARR